MPNPAHVHLILNHVPVIGVALGILLLVLALFRKSQELKKISLGFFVLMGAAAVPAFLTGEPAEGIVKDLPGVSRDMIERHEEAALAALIVLIVLGVCCLAALYVFRRAPAMPVWVMGVVLVLSIVSGGLMAYTANLGGQVHHQELRAP
ncbi:MAG: hypothetical protein ACE145_05445 [Terriglobia bacterium]